MQHIRLESSLCTHCNNGEKIIDLTKMKPKQFNGPGKVIIGDLVKYSWIVFLGVEIDDKIEADIKTLAMKGATKDLPNGIWKLIETDEKHHEIKYDHNSTVHAE